MAFKIGDLVYLSGQVKIVTGSAIVRDGEEYSLSGLEEPVSGDKLTLRFEGNDGTIRQARNMIFGDQIVKKPDANPPLVEEVVAKVQSTPA